MMVASLEERVAECPVEKKLSGPLSRGFYTCAPSPDSDARDKASTAATSRDRPWRRARHEAMWGRETREMMI